MENIKPTNYFSQTLVWCGVFLILGIASLMVNTLIVYAALITILFAVATFRRSELALLLILITTSSIVFEDQLPMLSAGISLHIPDILLLGSLSLIFLRRMVEPNFRTIKTPMDRPLLFFVGVTLLSTFIALYQSKVDPIEARRWIRILFYYNTFFIVTNLVRDHRQLNLLIRGILIIASITAAAMVVQFALGSSVQILPGRVEVLATSGKSYESVTRILPPGYSLVVVTFVVLLSLLVFDKSRTSGWIKLVGVGLTGMAILATFLRSYWSAIALVFGIIVLLAKRQDRRRLLRWAGVAVLISIVILSITAQGPDSRGQKLISASFERFSSLLDTNTFEGKDSSVTWRYIENDYAMKSIAEHPLLGQGMGFTYRPFDRRMDQSYNVGGGLDFRKFIHNGHFWIMLQSGLIGYGIFLWMSLTFIIRGFMYWRKIMVTRLRAVVLGFTLSYIAILVAAVVNSTFMQWYWTPIIGIMMGINEVIIARYQAPETAT